MSSEGDGDGGWFWFLVVRVGSGVVSGGVVVVEFLVVSLRVIGSSVVGDAWVSDSGFSCRWEPLVSSLVSTAVGSLRAVGTGRGVGSPTRVAVTESTQVPSRFAAAILSLMAFCHAAARAGFLGTTLLDTGTGIELEGWLGRLGSLLFDILAG